MRAARIQDPHIKLIPYTPASAMDRKKGLERLLTLVRNKAPRRTVQTQLRPGKSDFQVWIKTEKLTHEPDTAPAQ